MITGVNHITFAVTDLSRSFDFYVGVLGCKSVARWDDGAYLTAGATWIAILVEETPHPIGRADYSHIAFTCDQRDFAALVEALRAAGCASWSDNSSEGDSFYFEDPDGHKLEIHVGDLGTRLAAMKRRPWGAIQFFEDSEASSIDATGKA